ncbi:hypothetical protein ASG31_13425 [Chryseobacterium sp. Leaf404]|nr:hypothetical protein ASG31_13425 [Chryseobacterium sp. Leaf404]
MCTNVSAQHRGRLYLSAAGSGRVYDITDTPTGTTPAFLTSPAYFNGNGSANNNVSNLAIGFNPASPNSLVFVHSSIGGGNAVYVDGNDSNINLPTGGMGGFGTNNVPGTYFGQVFGFNSGTRNISRAYPTSAANVVTSSAATGDTDWGDATIVTNDAMFDYQNNIYCVARNSNDTARWLYRISLGTGVATKVATISGAFAAGSGITALGSAYLNGKMYVINADSDLYSINMTTGASVLEKSFSGITAAGNKDLASVDYFLPFKFDCSGIAFTNDNPYTVGVSSARTLRIPINDVYAPGTYTINITGANITNPAFQAVITSTSTFIDVPVTYNGAGASGIRNLTIDLNGSTTTCTTTAFVDEDSDRDGVGNSLDFDDDNDGITDILEGQCSSKPSLLKSVTFSAKGAGAGGRPTVTFEAPATGTGKRTLILLLSVERDHTPLPFGDNREAVSLYTSSTVQTSLMPTVTYGGIAMDKRSYNLTYDAVTGDPATLARLSNTQYVYTITDNNIAAGLQNIDLSTFALGNNAGDEFTATVLIYDNVRALEFVTSQGSNSTATNYPTQISVQGNTASGLTGSVPQDNILLAFSTISNENGMTLSPGWSTIYNSTLSNTAGTYSGTANVTENSSENDGLSYAIASLTNATGTQTATFTFNTANQLLRGAILYRIVGFGSTCVLTDTDSDGTPDYLDLDSDNDGCLDAVEGSSTITNSQLTNAAGTVTVGTGSSAANQNLPGPVGQTATNLGIPPLAGNGQGIGTAAIANQSPCYIDAKNDINQTPLNTPVTGFLLTNDVSGEAAATLSSAQFYTSTAGTLASLPVITTAPGTGTLTSVYTSTGTLAGTIRLYSTGEYRFTPATGFTGTVPVNYTAVNAVGGSDSAQLEIQVVPVSNPTVNDAPVALNDTGVTKTGVTLNSTVLGNDSDPDLTATLTVTAATTVNSVGANVTITPGTAITVSGVNTSGTAVANVGSFTLNAAGTYTFVPVAGFAGNVNPITYTISDGALTDTAVLSVEVKATTAPPVVFASDDARVTPKGVSTTGNVLANDTSTPTGTLTAGSPVVNGTTLTIGTATLISGVGTITFGANGNYTFAPLASYVGTTLLTYTACNSSSVCSMATLYLTSLNLPSYCYKEGITTTVKNQPAKHGITSLNRAGSGSTEWPTVRQGAWTVLESKTKGFVINRTTFVDADNNPATPNTPPLTAIPAANYVEGMMMYDEGVHCLKIYTGTANGWQCYNTQACPDF